MHIKTSLTLVSLLIFFRLWKQYNTLSEWELEWILFSANFLPFLIILYLEKPFPPITDLIILYKNWEILYVDTVDLISVVI